MYYRKPHGRGFTYQDKQGNTVKEKSLRKWFDSLVIPPAWTEVEITENRSDDVWVTGRDAKARKQYIYNPAYIERRQEAKYNRIIRFADKLEHMRRVTGQHLRHEEPTREKVLATMLRLMETAFFRPGSDAYTRENNTYGLTTLRSKHLTIEDDTLHFSYVGKSGKEQEREIVDARLAKIVRELDGIPGYEIFKFYDEHGRKTDVKSEHLNEYIHEVMGEAFSAKDFRTWAGTMITAMALDELGAVKPQDQKRLDANIREAVNRVAERLRNTPAVARNSYIDPRVIEDYTEGRTIRYFEQEIRRLLRESENLSKEEIGVLCLLKNKID